jgi:hypothetical protein
MPKGHLPAAESFAPQSACCTSSNAPWGIILANNDLGGKKASSSIAKRLCVLCRLCGKFFLVQFKGFIRYHGGLFASFFVFSAESC